MRVLLLVAMLAVSAPAHAQVLGVGDKLIELDVATDRGGKPAKLAPFRGRWVLVTIGASWCPPCVKELPVWDRLAGELRGRIAFVAVAIDEKVSDGIAFHDRLKLVNMTRMYLPQDISAVVARYGADEMPITFVADPSGVIRHVHSGFAKRTPDAEYAKMKAALEKLVPKQPPKPKPPAQPAIAPPVKPAGEPPVSVAVLWSPRWAPLLNF